ncbi:hypothetical protein GPALN_012557 [Globodera pallida]|nr:hypothetical protein GPALN_012557 [Globodera pallida]
MVESADSVLDEAAVLPPVVGSCIEPSNLALAIFGAIFGTLLLCTAFALLIWYLMRTDKFQIADKLLVLERGLLRKRGDGGKEEGEAAAAATTKRTDGRGVAEGTKRETETAAVGHQMDGMTTELKKGCRQLEMNIGVGGVKKEGRKCEDKKEKPNKGEEEEEEEAAQKADKTEEKRAEEEEEEAKTEEEEEPKEEAADEGAAAPEEEKPTENAVDEPQPTNGHRFRQGCGGQPVEQNNYSKREGGNDDDDAAERLGEEGRPADDEAEEGQKHSARLMTMLSAEQFGTLELNRRRLETERRQLREMGVI